ncbi:hypothetical protein TIFTF001_026944 [Ficus carica]|uniref:gibberellin 2beta-dioxygenase n=1 Tax=Ficus carica TaxID=3494 RepID=A0AA88DM49_FICCA|nr:hypothetical protein TIFTF001_026944 [Ficus carica]
MVVLSKPEHFPFLRNCNANDLLYEIPLIDLSKPESKTGIVKACEDFGFFKVVNHGVPMEFIRRLESQAVEFFSLPLSEKEKAGPASPLGYGHKRIGRSGDMGWVEYLLLTTDPDFISRKMSSIFGESENTDKLRIAFSEYISAVKKMACEILELMAEGLTIQPRNVFSKLLMDEESDSMVRLNHYPPCQELEMDLVGNGNGTENGNGNGNRNNKRKGNVIGFGEHTDPQIISVQRSNNTTGLQISLRDGSWISVPPDQDSFFINVGDSLQVMTNRRFQSVRHRVITNSAKSRVSMIYFGGPPLCEKIAPLPCLTDGEESLYKEFTWFEFKNFVYNSKLADNRLGNFEKFAP